MGQRRPCGLQRGGTPPEAASYQTSGFDEPHTAAAAADADDAAASDEHRAAFEPLS